MFHCRKTSYISILLESVNPMRTKNYRFSFVILLILSIFLFAACSQNNDDANNTNEEISENQSNNEAIEANDDASSSESESNAESTATQSEEEHRIVATTVAIVEFMDALEIDLVGIPTSYKSLPDRYADATEIGNPMWPDMEIVRSLNPTHVLSVTTLEADLKDSFTNSGIDATFMNLESVDDMLAGIMELAEQYDRVDLAEQLINDFEEQMAAIEGQVAGEESPSVLILMGIPGSYIVGTEHSYIGDLVTRAGGVNAVTDRDEEYISANTEYLQQLNPDVILRAAHGAPEEVVKMFDREFQENDIWKHFDAVKNDRVYDLEETL